MTAQARASSVARYKISDLRKGGATVPREKDLGRMIAYPLSGKRPDNPIEEFLAIAVVYGLPNPCFIQASARLTQVVPRG